ncbi:hypothetical protein LINPERHAP1_LOCUS22337 [Linum perenne]
MSRQITWILKP